MTFVLVGISLLVKYVPLLANDLRTVTDQQFPPLAIRLWLAFVILLPFFISAPPLVYPAWWFLILRGYMNKNEKGATLIIAALLFLSGMVTHAGAAFLSYPQSQVNREIFLVDHGMTDSRDYLTLDAWIKDHPADADVLNSKALLDIKRGDFSSAAMALDKSLSIEPDNARYYNHLGIALAKKGLDREALKAFENSITLSPRNPIYHYNLSRMHQQMLNFYEAEKSVMNASELAPGRVRKLLDMESNELKNNFVIDPTPVHRLIARQMKDSPELQKAADGLWQITVGIFPRSKAAMAAFIYVILILLLDRIPQDRFSKKCHRCGRIYYVGGLTQRGLPLCLQCDWINSREGRAKQTADGKVDDVRQYRKARQNLLAKCDKMLPGMGMVVGDRMVAGVLRLLVISAALILLLSGGEVIRSIIPRENSTANMARLAGLAMLVIAYWRAFRSEPARVGG